MYAELNIDGQQVELQCQDNERIEDLYLRGMTKIQKEPSNEIVYMYNGKNPEPKVQIKDIINRADRNRNRLSLIISTQEERFLPHKNIICPDCYAEADLIFKDYKINLSCENGHINNNLYVTDFRKMQEIDASKIICDCCEESNLAKKGRNKFFRCIKCKYNLCFNCKEIHLKENEKKHKNYLVKYKVENYECYLHKKNFNSYCENHGKDLCENCKKDHKHCEVKEYSDLLPDINRKNEIKEQILNSQKSLIEQINSIIEYLNDIKGYMESYNKLNMELLDNYNPNYINYRMIKNIKSINFDEIIKDLNKININDDLINKFQNIMNLYYRRKYSNELTLIYKINKSSKKVKIFGDEFVRNNEAKCKIIVDDKESELKSDIYINRDFQRRKSKVMVILKDVKNIRNMNEAFKDTSLVSVPDINKIDTSKMESMVGTFENCQQLNSLKLNFDSKNLKNVSHLFSGCINLHNLEIQMKNTENIEDMSYMFHKASMKYIKGICNFKTPKVKKMDCMFLDCNQFELVEDISGWDTRNVENMDEMFKNCKSIKSLPDISQWNTSKVKDFHEMFCGCESLKSLPDISKWDVHNTNDIHGLFCGCISIISLPDISKWQIKNVTNLSELFADCQNLLEIPDISKWDLSKVSDISRLFFNCFFLKELPCLDQWNICNVENMSELFSKCRLLHHLPNISSWNTSKVRIMSGLFNQCTEITSLPNIAKWDTKRVTHMDFMFNECNKLNSIPDINNWEMCNVTNINSMFAGCLSLRRIPNISEWDISKVKSMADLFHCCKNLEIIPDLSEWCLDNVKDMSKMFYQCESLINNLDIFKGKFDKFVNKFKMFERNIIVNNAPDIGINSMSMNNMDMRQRQFCQQMGMIIPNMPYDNFYK